MSNITATQLAANLRMEFNNDVAMAKRRKETLNTPSVRDGFKSLAKVLKKAAEIYPEGVNHSAYVYANASQVDAQQVRMKGEINITGAPQGTTVKSETKGAQPIRMNLLGANI
jgi:hypothetical protein